MTSALRALLAAAVVCASASVALASASTTPTQYQPDPALKTETMGQLTARVRTACAVTQAKLRNTTEASVGRACDCYSGRTMRALSPDEVQNYRDTGVFSETARAKALTSLDACRLQRPAM